MCAIMGFSSHPRMTPAELDKHFGKTRSRGPDMTRIERLRSALPAARVWTYTYRPLFGMTSATDPAGQTTRYGYDSAGRLTHTSIDGPGGEQQLIEYNEYHIVNP